MDSFAKTLAPHRGRQLSAIGGTVDPAPLDYVRTGLIGYYDALTPSAFSLDDNGRVIGVNNLVEGGLPLYASPDGGPMFAANHSVANNKPALVWPNTANLFGLELAQDAPCSDVFAVMAYRNGTETTFDEYCTLITPEDGLRLNSEYRLMGAEGSNSIHTNNITNANVSINGGAWTQAVLPLPLSVVRFQGPRPVAAVGSRNSGRERAWQGVVCAVLAYHQSVTLTQAEIDQNTAFLMDRWGIA